MGAFKNLTGKTFGMLFVESLHEITETKTSFNVTCQCGVKKTVASRDLLSGNTKSCGCLQKKEWQKVITKHSLYKSQERKILSGMKTRCYNKKSSSYHLYGGKGVVVCDRWLGESGLKNFILDMGKRPTPKHSIERVSSNGNYEPSNCRWATNLEQARNRASNIKVVDGITGISYSTVTEAAESIGIKPATLLSMIKGRTKNKTNFKKVL